MATLYDKPAQVQPEIIPDAYGELPSEEYTIKAMPKVAGPLGLTATFVLIIFFITNTPTAIQAGAGTFTFWVIGAITFFIPCVIATAQLGHMFPHEGSLYNWTHRAFGGYWSFFVAFCAWFPCILLMIVAADAVVGYLQGRSRPSSPVARLLTCLVPQWTSLLLSKGAEAAGRKYDLCC